MLALASGGLLQRARERPGAVLNAETRCGQRLFLKAEPGRLPPPVALPRRAAQVRDALAELDTGDERMRQCLERARKVAGKPIPILLQGESGVGKEMVAAAIHASGPRRERAMVAVNCAALPEHLIEAELFGYAPGAFTGARREGCPGRIREAHGGTLFLDEIGDMPLTLQSRLLRVLQERQVVPLGGGKPATVDFALIAASHRPLKLEVERGRFRADLVLSPQRHHPDGATAESAQRFPDPGGPPARPLRAGSRADAGAGCAGGAGGTPLARQSA